MEIWTVVRNKPDGSREIWRLGSELAQMEMNCDELTGEIGRCNLFVKEMEELCGFSKGVFEVVKFVPARSQ